MKIIHLLEQGSESWHAFRAAHFGASEAAAMLGISKYQTRAELLRRKATGIEPEVSPQLQAVFDRGHQTEIGGRVMAQAIIGQELYPVTVSEGTLSASCDGLTMLEDIAFEHKQYNATLADSVRAGNLPEEHQPQCQQVMMLTGADKLLFMVSDGTSDNCAWMWVEPDYEWRKVLTQGWTQFAIDLEAYEHTEAVAAPVAASIEALPALMIQVEGKVLATNLDQFKEAAQTFIANIKTELVNDQDFADADKMVKFLKDGEERLALCKDQAQSQAKSIDELFRTIDAISGQMRDKRLALDKLVRAEKENRRAEIVKNAQIEITGHVRKLNERIGGQWMPVANFAPFAEAVKGLKSLDSMRDKVATAIANAKIEANEIADLISANRLELVGELDWSFLVPDFAAVCTKARDDFNAMLMARIAKHNEAQAAKDKAAKDAEAARIAAAVEAERKAGEARAAAAIEAERMAEARRVADAAQQLQQSDMAQSLDGLAGKSVRAADHIADAGKMAPEAKHAVLVDAGDEVRSYLNTLGLNDKDCGRMRAVIMGWEQYKAEHRLKAAA